MSQDQSADRSGLPGTTGSAYGQIVGQRSRSMAKRELVILLKPTVIGSPSSWDADLEATGERFSEMKMIQNPENVDRLAALAPFAAEWDREHTFPAEALKELGELGQRVVETADHIGQAAGLDPGIDFCGGVQDPHARILASISAVTRQMPFWLR